ncbi:S8 family serine peptidase [Paraclostridium sp. AKS46]|nr:S8 family serine peptidase [Paraclostridium sp. AKS46]
MNGKIKIAVIDTGIDINDNSLKKYIKFNKNIQLEEIVEYKDLDDIHGHGTLCSKTILSVCKETDRIEIYPIKIFNQGGRTSNKRLLDVLERNLNSDIDLINISAATLNDTYRENLENICDKLKNGKIIISSNHKRANDRNSFPTIFNSVIGVDGSDYIYSDNSYIYEKDKKSK